MTSFRQFAPDDFYRAFAIAMLNWQKVEAALFWLLFSLYENGNLAQAGATYYCLDSFGAKLRLVDAIAGAVLRGQRLKDWESLCDELKAASGDRNVLAHLTAVIEFQKDDSMSLVLAPHIHVPKSLLRKRKKKYDAAECECLAFEFEALASKVEAYTGNNGYGLGKK